MTNTQIPKPLAAAAGAGDLAVEKIRELSKVAADKFASMESDPAAFADRVQGGIEARAETVGTAVRSATTTVRERVEGLSEKAQSTLHAAFEQAGDTYETLAQRGEEVVTRLRGEENGHVIESREPTVGPSQPAPVSTKAAPKRTPTSAKKSTTAKKTTKTTSGKSS